MRAVPARRETNALDVARLTLASITPGTDFNAFSTRATQVAQVMPSMRSSACSRGTR
jgi:hypothetical protein